MGHRVKTYVRLLLIFAVGVAFQAVLAKGSLLLSPPPGSNLGSSTVVFSWSAGPGGFRLHVGTTEGSSDLYNSGYLPSGTLSQEVSGLPASSPIFVLLWCETAEGSNQYFVRDFNYNRDMDQDGIYNEIDDFPGVSAPKVTLTGSDFALTINGSGRVASLESPTLFDSTFDDMSFTEVWSITKRVYELLSDNFDFIIIASNQTSVPSGTYSGQFYNAKNTIGGIGKNIFDRTSLFGSLGRLQGAIHLTSTNGLSNGPSLHELAHNWGNSMVSVPSLVDSHWGYSNIGGQLGGWQPDSLEKLGDEHYQARNPRTGNFGFWSGFANGGNALPFSPFELYTMGLIGPDEVGHDIKIANGFSWIESSPGTFTAADISTVTMSEVIATDGPRTPDPSNSQKSFRALYLILTKSPLTIVEWGLFDEDVYRFSLAGDEGSGLYNFWEATGGRASLAMGDLQSSIRSPELRIMEFTMLDSSPRSARIQVMGEAGVLYSLQSTRNLETWMDETEITGTGQAIVFDHIVGNTPALFFRVIRQKELED